jgi:hypothetical protein
LSSGKLKHQDLNLVKLNLRATYQPSLPKDLALRTTDRDQITGPTSAREELHTLKSECSRRGYDRTKFVKASKVQIQVNKYVHPSMMIPNEIPLKIREAFVQD